MGCGGRLTAARFPGDAGSGTRAHSELLMAAPPCPCLKFECWKMGRPARGDCWNYRLGPLLRFSRTEGLLRPRREASSWQNSRSSPDQCSGPFTAICKSRSNLSSVLVFVFLQNSPMRYSRHASLAPIECEVGPSGTSFVSSTYFAGI